MILTCPECATSYFVDDSRIPTQGRRVRCSSCGHRWTALPDGSVAPGEPEDAVAAAPELESELSAFDASSFPPEEDVAPPEVEEEPLAPEPPPPLRPYRAPGAAASRRRASARAEARSSAMLWAGVAAVAAALIASAIIFRSDVVRMWPKSSAAYAGLGLSVDGGGLVFEQVRADPAFLGGRPVLSVTGAIRNVRDEDLNSPPLRISLLNRDGKAVASKIAKPLDPRVPARSRRHFAIAILDPPANARDLEVRFEGTGAKSGARAKAVVTPAVAPAPPAAPPTTAAAPVAGATPPPPSAASIGALTEHG